MKRTIAWKTGIISLALAGSYVFLLMPVSAHEHANTEHHEDATAETEAATMKRLETLIDVLKQLIAVMTEFRAQHPEVSFTPSMPTPAVVEHHHDEADTTHEVDTHDEHADEAVSVTPHLVIEIEEHMGKTHAHVRYVDKPEEMFFVDAVITDEDGIVAILSTKTGFSADEVRDALKYTSM